MCFRGRLPALFGRLTNPPSHSTTETPTIDKPTTDKPTTDKPTTDKPTTDKPTTDKPTTEMPTTEIPTTKMPTTETTTTETPMIETYTSEITRTETPTTEKSTIETPMIEKPTTEKPATENFATEKPTTETPTTEKLTKATKRGRRRQCSRIVVRGQGPDGICDAQTLYALRDTGATHNCITKSKLEELMGRADAYYPHRIPRKIVGFERLGTVQSIGVAHLLFYLDADDERDEYEARFEIVDDNGMGPERCNHDVVLSAEFLEGHNLIIWDKRIAIQYHRVSACYEGSRAAEKLQLHSYDNSQKRASHDLNI